MHSDCNYHSLDAKILLAVVGHLELNSSAFFSLDQEWRVCCCVLKFILSINGWQQTGFTAFKILSHLLASRISRLAILVATWFFFRQTYINLSTRNISNKICSLLKNLVLRPLSLEPMDGFCDASLKWSIWIYVLMAVVFVFRCTWACVEAELKSFWTELQEYYLWVIKRFHLFL
jgi:hypothetical protein